MLNRLVFLVTLCAGWPGVGVALDVQSESCCHGLEKSEEDVATELVAQGEILLADGKAKLAEQRFRRAIWKCPDHQRAHYRLARLLAETNRKHRAIFHFQYAVQAGSGFFDDPFRRQKIEFEYGRALFEAGQDRNRSQPNVLLHIEFTCFEADCSRFWLEIEGLAESVRKHRTSIEAIKKSITLD